MTSCLMIELFSRMNFELREQNGITPIHIEEDISSLSAILLDDDYYQALLDGRVEESGYSVLRPEYLILFKAKAYLDLRSRKLHGERIDSFDIRLAVEMALNPIKELPLSVYEDIGFFISKLKEDEFDDNSLKTYRVTTEQVIHRLKSIFNV